MLGKVGKVYRPTHLCGLVLKFKWNQFHRKIPIHLIEKRNRCTLVMAFNIYLPSSSNLISRCYFIRLSNKYKALARGHTTIVLPGQWICFSNELVCISARKTDECFSLWSRFFCRFFFCHIYWLNLLCYTNEKVGSAQRDFAFCLFAG